MSELLATAAAHGLIAALGAAILHSIWQITIVAAAVAAMLAVMKRATPDARYLVACAGLALSLALPMATVVTRISAAPVVAPTAAEEATLAGASHNPAVAMSEVRRRDAVSPRWLPGAGGAVDARLPWLVAAWAAGVMLLSIRLLGGWIGVVRLARRSVCEPRADWRASFERVLARMQMRRAVRLVESVAVSVPTAIGWIRPVVLLPAAALAGLTPAQVEAIIAHELAHVRRFDYLVNVCQAAIETLLFYHPGVWWLSRAIRAEREHCCDDAAVRLVGDALGYARALTRLEEQRDRAVALALAATGGPFMNRIKRLRPTGAARTPWPVPLAILLVLVAVVAGGAVVASPAYVPSRPAATVAPPQSLGADVRNTVRPGSLADDIGNELRQLWVRFRRRVNNFAAQAAAQSAAPKPSPAPKAKPAPGPKPTPAPAPDDAAQRPAAPKVDFDFDAIFADVERTLREAELHYGTATRELEREFTPEKQAETRRALEEARRQMARVTRDMARHRADYARVMRDYERQARELSREQVQKELKNHREDIERALRDYRRQMREYTRQLRDSEQRAEGQETPRPPVPPAPPVSRAPQMAPPVPPEPPRPTPAPQLALPAPPAAPAPLSPSPRGRRSRVLPPPLPPPAPTAVAPTPAPAPPARLAPPAPSTPPPAPTAMAPPAPPPPPASPARPAPPAPPPVPLSLLWQSSEQAETHISRSDDGRTLDVRAKGRVETSDDDSDIKRLSPGGYFIISDLTGGKTVTFEARAVNGSIERKWTGLTGATERRQWLADHLAELRRR